jgi:hypothetical protein
MTNQIVHIEISNTERRTILGGATTEQHRELMELEYRRDSMANQYRRTKRSDSTYRDGVMIRGSEVAEDLGDPSIIIPEQIVYIERSRTERRAYLGGTSLQQHRQLLADGWHHDRLSNQYRKTEWDRGTYVDGKLLTDESEVANSNAA